MVLNGFRSQDNQNDGYTKRSYSDNHLSAKKRVTTFLRFNMITVSDLKLSFSTEPAIKMTFQSI